MPKRGGSTLSFNRVECTDTMALYGTATEMGWRDLLRSRRVLLGHLTSSLAQDLSIGMHMVGGGLDWVSIPGAVLGKHLPFWQILREFLAGLPETLKFACQKVPLSTISPANEVPPRRGRDLILLPHVLSYPGAPR